MHTASREWLIHSLPEHFKPFATRWRDSFSSPAKQFKKLHVNGEHLGHLDMRHRASFEAAFEAADLPLREFESGFDVEAPGSPQEFSACLMSLANRLHALGLVPGWRNEEQLVMGEREKVLATTERALFKTLGLRTRAVHVHVENHLGQVWTGVRSQTKHDNPGMLDNLAAGGVASAEDIQTTLWRELDEEAGLGPDDFSGLEPMVPHELALSRPLLYGGWHHETVILFRGRLRPGHRPRNRDGEVAGFQLMNHKACIQAINAWQFTPDAALCCALALSEKRSI